MERFYWPAKLESIECAGTFDAALHPSRYGIFVERLFLIDAIQSEPARTAVALVKLFAAFRCRLNSKFA